MQGFIPIKLAKGIKMSRGIDKDSNAANVHKF
jgi:hypothetical protein